MHPKPGQALSPAALCQRSDPADIPFESTAELEDLIEIPGQERALEALHFATGIKVGGHNVYVLGQSGSGRHDFVRHFLENAAAARDVPGDWCYVNNFDEPRRPLALPLPAGMARQFAEDVARVVADARTGIPAAFESEDFQSQRESIAEEFKEAQESAFREVEEEASKKDVGVVQTPTGVAFVPVREGEAMSPEEFQKLPKKQQKEIHDEIGRLTKRLQTVLRAMPKKANEMRRRVEALEREVATLASASLVDELKQKYAVLPAVTEFLQRMQDDMVEQFAMFLPGAKEEGPAPVNDPGQTIAQRYAVNVLVSQESRKGAPVVFLDKPSFPELLGRIEHESEFGSLVTRFDLVRPGALHRANGGFLVLDAERLLAYPQAWDGLKRALKSGEIRTRSLADDVGALSTVTLEPEAIPLKLKVVLIGARRYYYLLEEYDPEFSELFKVMADFEDEMVRTHGNVELLARWLTTIIRREGLKHLARDGVARLVEAMSRKAEDSERLSTDIHYASDLLSEAHYWARQNGNMHIGEAEIQLAIDARVRRASRVRDRMQEELIRETFRVESSGTRVGQVNGLAVMQVGGLAFGRPQRISAAVTMGSGEVVDIEREVKLGGPLHSKGVLILGGYLRSRYVSDRPLSLAASLVFEQSYGGVDGDSASTAELCVLISAISGVPLKQSLAITGSVDQHGRVQAIGGVNEKIEGFFDICRKRGLTGEQGVLIPLANAKHLMLRRDVVEAVEDEQFNVWPVDHVDQALELLTGMPAGERDARGHFPEGSVNRLAQDRLDQFASFRQSFGKGKAQSEDEDDGDE